MGVHLKPKPLSFRRKNTNPLAKLLKEISKETPDAVERLAELAKSKDEKIALGAASKLVDMHIEIAAQIDKDDVTRTLAELKYNKDGPRELEMEDDDTPQINFNDIQDVD